jgi:glycosyltransferase involved in cell wall biosynthesis
MILGIDAINLIKGGGVTHLREILKYPEEFSRYFDKVYIWSNKKTLSIIPDSPLYIKRHNPVFEKSVFSRILWRKFSFNKILLEDEIDILFMPGGPSDVIFSPKVTMSRNMHPYVWKELFRYSATTFFFYKYLLIRFFQPASFRKFDAIIFLNFFAKKHMLKLLKNYSGCTTIISHGINPRFSAAKREFKSIDNYNNEDRFKILYISKIDVHKHQYKVAEAVLDLANEGYPIEILFIGSVDDRKSFSKLNKFMTNDRKLVINYFGDVAHDTLPIYYNGSDLFVFASSCENLPNILLEAMSSCLPIACSNFLPMPEILKDAGLYFNPESSEDIKEVIKKFLESSDLRKEKAKRALSLSKEYSWKKTASETASFLHTNALKFS